jgi:hypothetical protein
MRTLLILAALGCRPDSPYRGWCEATDACEGTDAATACTEALEAGASDADAI